MNSKALECSKSIQSGKWLQIEYDNTTDQKRTFFWIAIEDIEIPSRRMKVKMFNPEKSRDVLDGTVYFDNFMVWMQDTDGSGSSGDLSVVLLLSAGIFLLLGAAAMRCIKRRAHR